VSGGIEPVVAPRNQLVLVFHTKKRGYYHVSNRVRGSGHRRVGDGGGGCRVVFLDDGRPKLFVLQSLRVRGSVPV
jgi:hypothetical protein